MEIPFVNCNATKEMIESFKEILLPHTNKPDKNGDLKLSGPGFAQALAEYWNQPYCNDKAAFDVLLERPPGVLGSPMSLGIEAKLKNHQPEAQLFCELANGTAQAWAFITNETGKSIYDDISADVLGNAYIDFCWSRWRRYKKSVNLAHSIFVIGQVYLVNDVETCKVYTVPLNEFPIDGDLNWTFTDNTICGTDSKNRKIIEWYWKNNGLSKYYPPLECVSFESVEFSTHSNDLKTLWQLAKSLGYRSYLEQLKSEYRSKKIDFSKFKIGLQIIHQMYPDNFALDHV